MSARARHQPWFGTVGDRFDWAEARKRPEAPRNEDPATFAPADWQWAPGEVERAAARGWCLGPPRGPHAYVGCVGTSGTATIRG